MSEKLVFDSEAEAGSGAKQVEEYSEQSVSVDPEIGNFKIPYMQSIGEKVSEVFENVTSPAEDEEPTDSPEEAE